MVGEGLFLERALARLGLTSRRQGRRWIAEGRVLVNGSAVRDPYATVNPDSDRITVDGPVVARAPVYLALHKPVGFHTTRLDVRGRSTVFDLIPGDGWLFPVGRLDAASEGLLLFTNDGPWGDRITDPRHHVAKQYRVTVDRPPLERDLQRLRTGVVLDGLCTRPAEITETADGVYDVVLREGRNRQLRRMFAAVGAQVSQLCRVRIGPVLLDGLAPGETRALMAHEVRALRDAEAG